MNIIVIIVTYNSENTILDCLVSIYANLKLLNIILVDCNSNDKTRELVQKKFPKVNVINTKENLGFAKANNIGIEYALKYNPDYFLILNPDVFFLRNSLTTFISEVKKRTKAIYGPKIYRGKNKIIWSAGGYIDVRRYTAGLIGFNKPDNKEFNESKICDFISGTCVLIPKELIKYGLKFYEPYFLYYEDVEFCLKAKKLGFYSVYIPKAKIIHYETSSLKENKSFKNYYLARNHLLFVERNAPFKVKLRELARVPKTIIEHNKLQEYESLNGIKDYFLRRFGKYE